MSRAHRPLHIRLAGPALIAGIAAAACWVMAMPLLSPQRETMTLGDIPVVVDYVISATPDQVGLPFYENASVEDSFAYTVTTQTGARVSSYAAAVLVCPDPPEEVAAYYSTSLPGRPEAELVEDASGKHYVLAVGNEAEVRKVTVAGHGDGSRIELVRAAGPIIPAKPVRPRGPDERAT